MSLRTVKKLQQRQNQTKSKQIDENNEQQDDSDQEQEIIQNRNQKKNPFQFLNDESDSDKEEEQVQNNENKEEEIKKGQSQPQKKKKNNNKKKKKQQQQQQLVKQEKEEDEDNKILDDIIQQQKQQNINKNIYFEEETKLNECNQVTYGVKLTSILELKPKLLNYNKEISKYFKGAKLSDDKSMEGLTANEKRSLKLLNGRQFKSHKNYYLSYHKKPHAFMGEKLQCEFLRQNENGQKEYIFTPTKKYEHLQEAYESLKNTLDPNNIFEFLNQNPFHLDALYDVGEFFRLKGDYKQANQLSEQILYVYEESFGYEFGRIFQDTQNSICLNVSHNKYSKTLFQTIHKFIDILGKKGCYKSALEFNKFLIKLNPIEDPTGSLLTIDYQAISAQQYSYLLYFTRYFCKEVFKNNQQTLLYLPNYLFSCALAKFKLALFTPLNQKKSKNQQSIQQQQPQLDESELLKQCIQFTDQDFQDALSSFQKEKNHLDVGHNALILTAILLYPNAMVGIVNTVEMHKQVVSHSTLKEWQKKSLKDIIAHKFFADVSHSPMYSFLQLQNDKDIEGLNKLIEIYLERSKLIWKHNHITLWIKAAMGFVLNKIEGVDGQQPFNYSEFIENLYVEDYGKQIPFNLSKYVQLTKSNFSDNEQQFDVNNIPDENQFQQQMMQNQPQYNPINTNQNFLSLLLNSLLPWVNLPNQDQQNQQNINQEQQMQQMMQQMGLQPEELEAQLAQQYAFSDEEGDQEDQDQ